MSTIEKVISSSRSEWEAQTLRCSVFTSKAPKMPETSWWKDLAKEEAENKVTKPREGIYQEDGRYGNGRLSLNLMPIRIDWQLTTEVDTEKENILLSLGGFKASLDQFNPLMLRWLDEMCPPTTRLAFGAVAIIPVKNREEGYRRLSEYLPFKLDPEGSADFSYQINRSRPSLSGVPDLKLNRLSKWSVGSFNHAGLAIDQTGVRQILKGDAHYYCRVELDINTAIDYQNELPHEKVSIIYQELVHLASEITIKGDVP